MVEVIAFIFKLSYHLFLNSTLSRINLKSLTTTITSRISEGCFNRIKSTYDTLKIFVNFGDIKNKNNCGKSRSINILFFFISAVEPKFYVNLFSTWVSVYIPMTMYRYAHHVANPVSPRPALRSIEDLSIHERYIVVC